MYSPCISRRIATFGQNKPHKNDWLKIKINVFKFKSNFFELASASLQGFGEGEWGRKRNMVPITSLLNTTYHRLPLCLLYPSHPRAFPNLHSFPSNSLPLLSPSFTSNTMPDRSENMWESLRRAFLSSFSLFLLVVTIYHCIQKTLS